MVLFQHLTKVMAVFIIVLTIILALAQYSEAAKKDESSQDSAKSEKVKLRDGTYEGRTSANYRGTVIVTVKEGMISEIQAKPLGKDARYKREIDGILAKIIETQEYQVDAYSGATRYTVAVVQAVENALRDAVEK